MGLYQYICTEGLIPLLCLAVCPNPIRRSIIPATYLLLPHRKTVVSVVGIKHWIVYTEKTGGPHDVL